MTAAGIALGSNLGDRRANLEQAVCRIGTLGEITARSDWIETRPEGGASQPDYLNGALLLETILAPRELLEELLRIEGWLGRERPYPGAPRTLDLDLLFYDDLVLAEPALELPHPRIAQRRFVLEPLVSIAPDWCHPILQRTAQQLLQDLENAPGSSSRAGAR